MPPSEQRRGAAQLAQQYGLHVASHVPWPVWTPAVALGSLWCSLRPPRGLRQWRLNVATLTGRTPGRRDTFRATWSWARNFVESLHLGAWSGSQITEIAVLSADDEQRLRSLAADPGAVIALPHMGSWDLAGAWACTVGMPVSTVAEQLFAPEYALFKRVREDLGFVVHSHREASVVTALIDESRQGRLVCLLADRDFTRRGVPVQWPAAEGPLTSRMPQGPAHIALKAGAVLMGIACHYEKRRMRLVVSQPITPPDGADHAEAVASMTQQLCDFFAAEITEHPHDWHMLQPIFPGVRVP